MAFNRMERVMIPRACLVAILLVARSSSGVNFVFHYPPNPKIDSTAPSSSVWRGAGSHTDGTTSDSNSSAGSSDEDFDAPESGPETKGELADIDPSESDMRSRSYPGKQRRRHRDDHDDDDDEDDDHVRLEQSGPAWESLFGFKVSFLASLLAPKATTCRTKFELTIDDLVFLGYPVQVKPDGTWKKKRKKKKARSKKAMDSELVSVQGDEANAGDEADDENDGDEGENQDSDASEKKDGMTMFHVVFVMNPPELEYHSRVQDMYGCVVKKFAKALTLEQARSDYVGRETELILRMRERAAHEGTSLSDLWQRILSQSNLASAIAHVYSAIAASKIAHVYINESIDLSLQIPIIQDTAVLPSLIEPQMPGLHLSTANSFEDDEMELDSLARHFTLLFLDEKDNIEKEIEKEMSDPTNVASSNLLYFVRSCKPTMSFVQIAAFSGLALAEVQVLARHLIYWRRARAIPPLNLRDYFIVSPNADMKKLSAQIPIYARKFPTLPSLPKMLSCLSLRPRPFSTLIPSKDHRRAYLDILAWLLRHGWVTQLRTFGLLKIPRDIKQKVAKERAQQQHESDQSSTQALGSTVMAATPSLTMSNINSHGNDANFISSALSAPTKPIRLVPNPPSSTASTTAVNTIASSTTIANTEDENFEDSLILEPQQANSLESAWIAMITRDQPPDITDLFERMIKYLNGQHALEKIPVREGISRKDCKRVLNAMEKYVCIVRHW